MNLKNYTSCVTATKSISAIEGVLIGIGVTNIMKKYEGGKLIAISFLVMVNPETILPFKLPAHVKEIEKYMWSEIKRPRSASSGYGRSSQSTKERIEEQAERTAWKLLHEWVEIQASMIKLKQAEVLEIFLPYVYDVQNDRSYYQQLKEGNFKALPSGR